MRLALEEWNGAWDSDPFDEPAVRAEASVVLDLLANALDDSGRAVLTLARNLGDRAFKRNGTLNVSKIAALTRQPQRTMARRVSKIKTAAMNLSAWACPPPYPKRGYTGVTLGLFDSSKNDCDIGIV